MSKNIAILGRVLLFCVIFSSFAFGNISTFIEKTTFNQGEEISFTIEAKGQNIEFPSLSTLSGIEIESRNRSEQTIQENGETLHLVKMKYTLIPKSSFIIPPIEVKVDDHYYKTNPIEITKNTVASTSEDEFQLILETKKEKIYVGEACMVLLIFKHKKEFQDVAYTLNPFFLDNFVIKDNNQTKEFEENGYKVFQKEYLFFPKIAGKYEIPFQTTRVTVRGKNFTTRKNIYSTSKTLEVSPLPNGINLLGQYTIRMEVNQREIEANKPLYLTLTIEGFGNIDELKEFQINIPNTLTHSAKPLLETKIENGKYGGKFVQKFSLIAENDFEIPPIELEFYNPKSDRLEKIQTKPIGILIKEEIKEIAQIESAKNPEIILFQRTTFIEKIGYILFGLLFGILSFYLFIKIRKFQFRKNSDSIKHKIFQTKNDKELYHLLCQYATIETLQPFIKLLEENIYLKKKNKIDKEELSEILEKF